MVRPPLPAGIVTFVLFDGNDAGIVEARGGVVLDAGPDVGVAVFAHATEGVEAARALVHTRPARGVVVHTGEVRGDAVGYSGPARNRAQRLHSIVQPGEIVLSGATASLVVDNLPTGTRLVALENARVRGLDRAEAVFALVPVPDPSATSRARVVPKALAEQGVTAKETEVLRALQQHLSNAEIAERLYVSERTVESHVSSLLRKLDAGNRRDLARIAGALLTPAPTGSGVLPTPATRCIGRTTDLERIAQLLVDERIVTVVGPAGVGKTRLVIDVAAGSDSAWFVDLTPVAKDESVPERVLWTLGGEQLPGQDALSSVAARVREQRLVVILDNCEHVLAGAATVAQVLAGAGEQVRVLATSREPLGIPGEAVASLTPLAVDDAVILLTERARAAGASVESSAADDVAALCARLDGLPLALELVAPRLRTFAAAQLLEILDHVVGLDDTGRGRPARHRTLDHALDWSYQLLDADERVLFDRLSVFRGTFALDAAIEICQGPVIHALPRLVDRSLAVAEYVDGTRRYHLLDTLRRFGERHLDAETARALHARHAAYFVAVAEEGETKLRGPDGALTVARLQREQDNFLHALEWAMDTEPETALRLVGALHLFWEDADLRRPAITWAERALAAAPHAPARVRLKALVGAASLLAPWDQTRARALADDAAALAADLDDPAWIARVLVERARVEAYSSTPDRAVEPVARALTYFESVGDTWSSAEVLRMRSYAEAPAVAVVTLADAHRRFTLTGDRVRIANTAYMLAAAYAREMHDVDRAEPLAREVVAVAAELGSDHEQLHGLGVLAECAAQRGDGPRAAEVADSCAVGFARLADHRCEARMQLVLAQVALRDARRIDALEYARSALSAARFGARAGTVSAALDVAATVLADTDADAARELRSSDDPEQAVATIDAVIVRNSVLATDAP